MAQNTPRGVKNKGPKTLKWGTPKKQTGVPFPKKVVKVKVNIPPPKRMTIFPGKKGKPNPNYPLLFPPENLGENVRKKFAKKKPPNPIEKKPWLPALSGPKWGPLPKN